MVGRFSTPEYTRIDNRRVVYSTYSKDEKEKLREHLVANVHHDVT
jgi:hypothetical protein